MFYFYSKFGGRFSNSKNDDTASVSDAASSTRANPGRKEFVPSTTLNENESYKVSETFLAISKHVIPYVWMVCDVTMMQEIFFFQFYEFFPALFPPIQPV